jgi:hypothetical protein
MLELLAIGQQVKDKNLHDVLSIVATLSVRVCDEVTAAMRGAPRRPRKFHICRNGPGEK